ncbi:MAG: hypothetical protein WB646_19000 [Steroidobacteraceae bacterium]
MSQLLTLFTTPIVYIYVDKLREALFRRSLATAVPQQTPLSG